MKTSKLSAILVLLALLGLSAFAATGCGSPGDSANDGQGDELGLETVVMTVDDSPVYWPEFLYWLRFTTGFYEDQNGIEAITDWTAQVNGTPLKQFILTSAVDYVGRHRALEAQAKEMGFALSDAQKQEMASMRAENVATYGSETEYQRIIRQTYVTESVYNYLLEIGYLSSDVFTALYGQSGEKLTDAELASYVSERGLLCARYVFLSDTGTGTVPLSAEEKAKNRELLQDLIKQLEASNDPASLFAEFVTKYGQDPNASPYAEGVVFTAAQMPAEFMTAFNQLQEGRWSGVVETGKGLYLIMRMPLKPDMIADQSGNTLRYRAAYEYLFEKQVNAWYADMKVKFTKAYDVVDLESLFGPDDEATTTTS
jgi:hypothetical protein